ncbi:MAG TPA: efflux RND transporter periplasmic adaptor subunit, partial [Polyangiales bacterium]
RVVTGQSVKSARALFVVANLDRLVFEVRVAESEAHVLAIGDRAELSRENSGAAIEGKVSEIGLLTGPELGSGVLVRVAVDNAARQLRPGASVSAIIHTSGSVRAVVIPTRAVVWIAGQPAVFVEHGHNAVGATPIGLGASSGELTEVSFGLASGQRIVSDGVQSLATESAL